MIRKYGADLHVHSLLSPCAKAEMTPRNIVLNAAALGIDILAITDHNASGNVAAAIEVAKQLNISVIPGMELQTREEIHVICLLPLLEALIDWQKVVDEKLPDLPNNHDIFGAQFVMNAQDELVAIEERMLLASTDLSLQEAVTGVMQRGGICIAAHVDRQAYSVVSQLGFIPTGIPFAALERSKHKNAERICAQLQMEQALPIICASDAHRLADLQSPKTWFFVEEPTLAEIIMALRGEGGRRLLVESTRAW